MHRHCFSTLALTLLLPVSLFAQSPVAGKNSPIIRAQRQDIYFYPAESALQRLDRKILFAPGDGGWFGFAVTVATTTASWGYDVYGLDTKRYLESFTGKTTLKETDVMSDFRQIAGWMTQGSTERVTLIGWSEGAGLCLLAAASDENKKTFFGLITLGLGESSVLGWRWSDALTYITGKDPAEPTFLSLPFLPKVAPLPLFMIQSSQDDYVAVETARHLFSAAHEPKRFSLIQARNHRYDGNRDEFFRTLREALQWINKAER
ncbi:MAG: alpha/beta hydrolase [Acidobacteria bacterium]|nr:alpha/beta hydrolase [Acidobacteriota bacterium]